MKKLLAMWMICVIFLLSVNVQSVFAFKEKIEFSFNGLHYIYYLEPNIKTSKQFDINFEINKFNRFGTKEERKKLLERMLDCGFDEEIAINYLFPNMNSVVSRMEKSINTQPQNAKLNISTNSEKVFNITKEKFGIVVDKEKIYKQICEKFLKGENMCLVVPTTRIEPEILAKDYAVFTNLRADFSTSISTSSLDRKHNIKNAMNALNKVEIYPNQVFSFNKIVGERTENNGYRNAKIIVNNEFVEGVGGGVCQVSSTLYNSALLAGLEVLEANKHSVQVGYVKFGFDAMVNFGSSDLKFRNNTSEKITIITSMNNEKIRIRIFGEDMKNVKYKLKNEILNVVEPIEEQIVDEKGEYVDKVIFNDESFILKKQIKGMDVKSYREKYIGDNLVSSELLRTDKFKVKNGVRVFGAKERETKKRNIIRFFDLILVWFMVFGSLGRCNQHS